MISSIAVIAISQFSPCPHSFTRYKYCVAFTPKLWAVCAPNPNTVKYPHTNSIGTSATISSISILTSWS